MDVHSLAHRIGEIADPTEDQLRRGRRQLDDATQQADVRVSAARRRRRRSGRRWGVAALAGVAAVTAAALVVPLISAPPASAKELLRVTAEAAGQQPDEAAAASYWYVRSELDFQGAEPSEREIWQGRTEDSVLRDQDPSLRSVPATIDPTQVRIDDLSPVRTEDLGEPAVFLVGGHSLSWRDLDALPTDPAELEAQLKGMVSGHPSGEENELWESVTGLLRQSPASPALRQALWEIAAAMPNVELIGPTVDAAGRQGVAIKRTPPIENRYPVVYIVDPETGALLEVQDLAADGTVDNRMTQLVQEPSDTAPVPQPPICGPGSEPERGC